MKENLRKYLGLLVAAIMAVPVLLIIVIGIVLLIVPTLVMWFKQGRPPFKEFIRRIDTNFVD